MNYADLVCKAEKVVTGLQSPFFFRNRKTLLSVDFGVCSLMHLKNNKYTSTTCQGCYSMNLLNIRAALRRKLENLPSPKDQHQLELFKTDLKALKLVFPELGKLRFYSFADFSADHMPYIIAASKIFEVTIISKALTFPNNREFLVQLSKLKNVWVSLSFNSKFVKHIYEIAEVVKKAARVQLNYTINYESENPDDLDFRHLISVWHLRNDRRRSILESRRFKEFEETNLCGVFTGDGDRTTWKTEKTRIVEEHGSCHKCNNCKCSLKDKLAGRKPALALET